MNDLVTRLRRLADTRRRGHSVHPDVLREAANAIDNLTAERDEARRLAIAYQVDFQREIAGKLYESEWEAKFRIAKERGWDCYKEDGK